MKPRKPNQQELETLIDYVETLYWYDLEDEDIADRVKSAAIAVFDDYITDSVGYAGKLMTVVWDVSPNRYEVFIWKNGEIEQVEQDEVMKK